LVKIRLGNSFEGIPVIILRQAASRGILLRDSALVIPNKRYRLRCCSEKIKNGDLFQVKLLVKGVAR
jgi:hypothetical protein